MIQELWHGRSGLRSTCVNSRFGALKPVEGEKWGFRVYFELIKAS
jgi:hypothetical protein